MNALMSKRDAMLLLGALGAAAASLVALAQPDPWSRMQMRMVVGPVVRIHEPRVPAGHAAEVWYLATQRWVDPARTQLRYCVYPRIEVTGTETWTTPFTVRLVGPRGPSRATTLASVLVPTPLPAGTSRELASSADWCVEASGAGRPPRLSVETDFGSVGVAFGPPPP